MHWWESKSNYYKFSSPIVTSTSTPTTSLSHVWLVLSSVIYGSGSWLLNKPRLRFVKMVESLLIISCHRPRLSYRLCSVLRYFDLNIDFKSWTRGNSVKSADKSPSHRINCIFNAWETMKTILGNIVCFIYKRLLLAMQLWHDILQEIVWDHTKLLCLLSSLLLANFISLLSVIPHIADKVKHDYVWKLIVTAAETVIRAPQRITVTAKERICFIELTFDIQNAWVAKTILIANLADLVLFAFPDHMVANVACQIF